ncbi:MAG: hypothetical protein AB7U76_25030 [Pirellulales bacterium]
MTTLATMKARIASELRRSNISSQIADAINTAIALYQQERWYWNEGRSFTVATVADQEFYTATDDADIGNIEKIDYITLLVNDQPYTLLPEDPLVMERLSMNGTGTGEPRLYSFYGNQLRFYPVPDAVYTIRIGCTMTVAAPATDSETDNPWMTDAEYMIRQRVKYELASNVLIDPELAANAEKNLENGYTRLRSKTSQRQQLGGWVMTPTQF